MILFLVLCGSAFKFKGVQLLLNAVVDYLPSPLDLPPVVGHHPKTQDSITRTPDIKGPFSALAFKTMSDTHGKLTFVRVYSGCLEEGDYVFNVNKGKKERASRLVQMHANKRQEIKNITCGGYCSGNRI